MQSATPPPAVRESESGGESANKSSGGEKAPENNNNNSKRPVSPYRKLGTNIGASLGASSGKPSPRLYRHRKMSFPAAVSSSSSSSVPYGAHFNFNGPLNVPNGFSGPGGHSPNGLDIPELAGVHR